MQQTPVTPEDERELVAHLRDMDRAEVWALSRRSPTSAVQSSVQDSFFSRAVRDDYGRLLCIWGVCQASPIGENAAPWMLGTPLLAENALPLIRWSRGVVRGMLARRFRSLTNIVWSQNEPSIRYLEAVGFTIGPETELPWGDSYRTFTMTRAENV